MKALKDMTPELNQEYEELVAEHFSFVVCVSAIFAFQCVSGHLRR